MTRPWPLRSTGSWTWDRRPLKKETAIFRLALYHLRYYKLLSGIIVLCLTIALFLPLVTFLAADQLDSHLYERSESTPILVGSKGSPFLLTFNAVYFKTALSEKLHFGVLQDLEQTLEGQLIPLHIFHSVKEIPVVGTRFDYFSFRGLKPAEGSFPRLLGEAVAGAEAARQLQIKTGDSVITDTDSPYDLAAEYPLKMRISGVLEATGTPDDNVLFVDLKTAWVVDGIGHGHDDLVDNSRSAAAFDPADPDSNPDDAVIFLEANEIVYNSRLKKYNEITPENIHTFHFHGDPSAFPLSALIVIPATYKEEVVDLLATLNLTDGLQALRPTAMVEEILAILLNLKNILDGFSALILVSTAAFLVLILSLQVKQRRGETLILERIGGGKNRVLALLGLELLFLLVTSAVLAGCLSLGALEVIEPWLTGSTMDAHL